MSVASNTVIVSDPTARAVQIHEAGVKAYKEGCTVQAEMLFREALEMFETHDGPESPDVAAVLCDLGKVAEDRCDYAAAERHLQRAATIAEQYKDEPDEGLQQLCLRAWSDLGRTQQMQNRYQQARQISQQALQYAEMKFGAESEEAADALNNLGIIGKFTGR